MRRCRAEYPRRDQDGERGRLSSPTEQGARCARVPAARRRVKNRARSIEAADAPASERKPLGVIRCANRRALLALPTRHPRRAFVGRGQVTRSRDVPQALGGTNRRTPEPFVFREFAMPARGRLATIRLYCDSRVPGGNPGGGKSRAAHAGIARHLPYFFRRQDHADQPERRASCRGHACGRAVLIVVREFASGRREIASPERRANVRRPAERSDKQGQVLVLRPKCSQDSESVGANHPESVRVVGVSTRRITRGGTVMEGRGKSPPC